MTPGPRRLAVLLGTFALCAALFSAAPALQAQSWIPVGPPGGDVRSLTPEQRPFALSPDGERVAYLADQLTDEVVELFESYLEHPRVRPATLPE